METVSMVLKYFHGKTTAWWWLNEMHLKNECVLLSYAAQSYTPNIHTPPLYLYIFVILPPYFFKPSLSSIPSHTRTYLLNWSENQMWPYRLVGLYTSTGAWCLMLSSMMFGSSMAILISWLVSWWYVYDIRECDDVGVIMTSTWMICRHEDILTMTRYVERDNL